MATAKRAAQKAAATAGKCLWISESSALRNFATFAGKTQGQQHIKPLHWYMASRLVVEGGFRPEDITPRPPFRIVKKKKGGPPLLEFDPSVATGSEATVLGGLKTKDVDVVAAKPGIGPVLAISCKGITGALRNLTNRMEETIGECTNLHITYPALVFGYFFVIRANRTLGAAAELISEADEESPQKQLAANDIAIGEGGEPVEAIIRYHAALRDLQGRRGIRNDVSRYEAVGLTLIEVEGENQGLSFDHFPPAESPLRIEDFFPTLYLRYDERYVFGAPDLKSVTGRLCWNEDSPAFKVEALKGAGYAPRIA